ncbi:arylesterase [Albibacterium sp.]|uniref:arylesterase n=1 Tax=Albibacterium sp. TaxID=2952885 RepID=UPI002C7B6426|nr:arylesterase [Albibacterium sp.]HUH19159.1 arylesterase [Albibacterium sp.]
MNFRILLSFFICFFILACSNTSNQQSDQEKDSSAIPDTTVETTQMKTILFFGNSLTAGYGLDDPNDAFPGLIQLKIDSLNLPYKTINAGLSGETSSGGKERIDWLLKQRIDVFVLELGANDGLRGLPVDETYKSLQAIIDKVKAAWPDCKMVLTGMLVPPSMGQRYSEEFKAVFINLAKENNMAFVPFLLENVAGEVELNQGDGIHPTVEGQKIVAETVWKILYPIL